MTTIKVRNKQTGEIITLRKKEEERGVGEELLRQAGLGTRSAVTGISALPVALADGINMGIHGNDM